MKSSIQEGVKKMRSDCVASASASKIYKMIESIQEGVKKMSSECASSISVHTSTLASSDHNNLQSSCNDDPRCEYIIPHVSIDKNLFQKSNWIKPIPGTC